MKKQLLTLSTVALLMLAGGATYLTYAAENEKDDDDDEGGKVEASALPAPVVATTKAAVPNGTFDSAYMEDEDGAKVYEVTMKSADGHAVELEILADGQLLETETATTEGALPPAVAKTFKEVLPGGKMEEMTKKTVVMYVIEKEFGGKTYELAVDPAGNVISLDAENEEEDD